MDTFVMVLLILLFLTIVSSSVVAYYYFKKPKDCTNDDIDVLTQCYENKITCFEQTMDSNLCEQDFQTKCGYLEKKCSSG